MGRDNGKGRMAEALRVRNGEEQGTGDAAPKVPEAVQKALGPFRRFREFLHDVRAELRNVTWPRLTDVRATTIVVIVTVFFFGILLFVVDQFGSWLIQQVFHLFKR